MLSQRRTPWQITWSVWGALFNREILTRIMSSRYAWFWLFAEPVIFLLLMLMIRLMIRGGETVAGSDRVTWMILGLTGFFMLRDAATRAMGAIGANKGLFAFRQVKPFDAIFVRIFVELFLRTIVLIVLLLIFGLIGHEVLPENVIMSTVYWLSLWLLGLGFGLMFSVLSALINGFDKVVRLITLPLLIISGVILPVHRLPPEILHYLMYNPILHGLELFRFYFFDNYWMVDGVSRLYFWGWILGTICMGLILYFKYEQRVKAA